MDRLSFLDQVVHKISTTGLPSLNMQGAGVFDPAKATHKVNAMILAEHIAARLSEFPILRKKLIQDPIKIADMRLVDHAEFDVWDHITFATLPSPGDAEVLDRHLAKFSAQELDQDKPLWRFEIIEGLEGGKIALAQKLSHATMDGMAAMKVIGSIFDMEPKAPAKLEKTAWTPEPLPTRMGLLRSALKETAQRFGVDAPKTIVALSKDLTKSAKQSISTRISARFFGEEGEKGTGRTATKAHPTSINSAISADRRSIGFAIFELHRLKAISKALDCKINDISLAMASEALASYFAGIGEKIDFDLLLCMPINVRDPNGKAHGNALALSMINARNTLESIPERLEAIKEQTSAVKTARSLKQSSGDSQDITTILSPLLIDLFAMILCKTQPWDKLPTLINAVVTNVPGPPGEMYLASMPIEFQIPMIPVFHKGALSIGVNSMGNNFSFGFHGCGKVVKQENMHFLVEGLNRAFRELETHALAVAKEKTLAASKPAIVESVVVAAEPGMKRSVKSTAVKKQPRKKTTRQQSVASATLPPAKKSPAKKKAPTSAKVAAKVNTDEKQKATAKHPAPAKSVAAAKRTKAPPTAKKPPVKTLKTAGKSSRLKPQA